MIRRVLIKISVVFLLVFIGNLSVNAGVCNGYDKDPDSGTCRSQKMAIWTPDYLNSKYGGYFIRPGYVASTSTGDGMAFCLDPGLPKPDKELTYIREINNSNTSKGLGSVGYYDDGVYRMYQYFYNNLIWGKNNGDLTDSFVNQQRSYFQYALRIWTLRNNFDYLDKIKAKFKNDAANFKNCANFIDNNITKDSSSVNEKYCFGDVEIHKETIQNYYNSMGQQYLWENPLKIETSSTKITGQDGKKYYRYNFDISFTNEKYSFFDTTYSQGISYKDISLGNAEFYLNGFTINSDITCSTSDICYNYSGGGVVSNGDSRQFIVELTEEQYNKYKDADGLVNVTMHYGYQHPLNIENIYTARYDLSNSFQRMLVIKNFVHEDSVTIGNKSSEINKSKCLHNSGGFMNSLGNKVSTLSKFIDSCGCNSVNIDLLNSSDLYYYNNNCMSSLVEEKYSGNINSCNDSEKYNEALSDTNFSNYTLGYQKTTKINNYCTEVCNENIQINNLKGRFTTVAGTYFKFNKYPELNANKQCVVNIDYDKWKSDYYSNLNKLVAQYNAWKKAVAGVTAKNNSFNNRSYSEKTNSYSYPNSTVNYEIVVIENNYSLKTDTDKVTDSYDSSNTWTPDTELKNFQNLSTEATSISNLKTFLKVCNNRFKEVSDSSFYDFNYKLNYYYFQTYGDSNIGTRSNTARSSYGGINDSDFTTSKTNNSSLTGSGSDKIYSTLTESGINNESIYTYDTDIVKNANFNIKYLNPEYNKYVEIFTGKITTEYSKGKHINLGYVYDTDITSIAKTGNVTYYEFSSLGSSDKKLFNHFKNGNSIKRYCDYEITNNVYECKDGICDSNKPKPLYVFRIVDSNNIDPNNRLVSKTGTKVSQSKDNGFKNWRNDKGYATKEAIESSDTYNPTNLEYSFTLDSATIKAIREYNANCDSHECNPINYSDVSSSYSELTCNSEGKECTSKFITTATSSSSIFGKTFAKIENGRDSWKKFEVKAGNKCYIDDKEIKNVTCTE